MKILLLEFRNETTWLCDIIVLEIEYISSWWLEKDERLLRNLKKFTLNRPWAQCVFSSVATMRAWTKKEATVHYVQTYVITIMLPHTLLIFNGPLAFGCQKETERGESEFLFFLISKNRNFITMIIIGCIYYFVNQ